MKPKEGGPTSAEEAGLLELAAGLARRAAAEVMRVRAAGFAVGRKADASPVTDADRVAEAVVLDGLRAACPAIPVVSEEQVAAAGSMPAVPGGRFWLVDPLDGTREFAAGLPEFTVNIGLVVEGAARLGVVVAPATGELFGGLVGAGAWKEDLPGDRRHPIRARTPPPGGIVVLASRHHADERELADLLAGRRVARLERLGSALKFCRVAEGVADLYPRLGRTMEWDTAAPQAVVEAAGGVVRTLDGARLRYAQPSLANPPFICGGRT